MVARAVFFDRDGVLVHNVLRDGRPVAPTRLEDFCLVSGAEESVRRVKAAGFTVVVVTNQPDIASGRTSWQTLDAMHEELRLRLPVDDIKVCPHQDVDACACRKPQPGMILTAAAEQRVSLAGSYLVGDRWRDIDAGRAAGCSTILIATDELELAKCQPHFLVASLTDAVDIILRATALDQSFARSSHGSADR